MRLRAPGRVTARGGRLNWSVLPYASSVAPTILLAVEAGPPAACDGDDSARADDIHDVPANRSRARTSLGLPDWQLEQTAIAEDRDSSADDGGQGADAYVPL